MSRRLTILAGSGALVREIVDAAREAGDEVQILPLVDRADLGVTEVFRVGDLPRLIWRIASFRSTDVCMVGGLKTSAVDREAFQRFAGVKGKPNGDGTLLKVAERLLSMTGATVIGAEEILPSILAGDGPIAGPHLDAAGHAAAQAGLRAARAFGGRDQGQAIVLSGGELLAEEDAAGTDALIRRVAVLTPEQRGKGPLVLAKALKPRQSRLSDRPAIGPTTIANAAAAGISIIAIEACGAVIVERSKLEAAAAAAGISVVGLRLDD